jgi:type IV secretory pathway VirB2 component (pilin)
MARKPGKPIHPLMMADALMQINSAASLFEATVSAVATVSAMGEPTQKTLTTIRETLTAACAQFRAAMWPEGEA